MKNYRTLLAASLIGVLLGILLSYGYWKIDQNRKVLNWKYGEWRKLSLVLDHIGKNYVDTIDMKSMTEGAISGALAELDPHSIYLPPVDLEEADTELAGNFDGIGIQFNVPNDTAIVLSVISGGPSEKAGLLQGDRIIKVDERVIAGMKTPQDSMVRLMKGPSGTKVKIFVKRGNEDICFDITRGKIPVNCIDAAFMINDTTGYVKLSKFTLNTYKEFSSAVKGLLDDGMKKLIFDLRGNTGGYLDQACKLSNEFLKHDDLIVYMEGRSRPRQDIKADGRGTLKHTKLVVLIDESSASSSEIFAGAMQDNDRGTIIGRRSFGKGLVQEPVNFTDGSGIRLTVARYFTPSGRCIQKPYSKDYAYDIYERYAHGEMVNADSIKVDKSSEYHTAGGRTVYGGGGIVPDIFVPVDTTKASKFFVACNKKATTMRFASSYFDAHRAEIINIDSYEKLDRYLSTASLESRFLAFAKAKDGLEPADSAEWEDTKSYMMPQVNALVGRYSKLGENAFYHLYLPIDNTVTIALGE